MKRLFLTLVLPLLTLMSVMAMSDARIRETARFLTDRMAYELQLTPAQYEDCFEVNYDFIYEANNLMDDVVYGYSDAIDTYYDYLDYRNEDLRYILNATQYGIFMGLDYFFRPIYTTARRWAFRIYDVYHNHHYYYYGLPNCYHTYHGLHSHHHHHGGFYVNRYSHPHHAVPAPIHRGPHYDTHRHNDFGDRYHHRDHGGHHNSNGHNNHDARPGGHNNNHGNGGHNNGGHSNRNDHSNGGHNDHGNAGQGGGNNHRNHGNAGQGGNNKHGNQGNTRPEKQHRSSERSSANRSHDQRSNQAAHSHEQRVNGGTRSHERSSGGHSNRGGGNGNNHGGGSHGERGGRR